MNIYFGLLVLLFFIYLFFIIIIIIFFFFFDGVGFVISFFASSFNFAKRGHIPVIKIL